MNLLLNLLIIQFVFNFSLSSPIQSEELRCIEEKVSNLTTKKSSIFEESPVAQINEVYDIAAELCSDNFDKVLEESYENWLEDSRREAQNGKDDIQEVKKCMQHFLVHSLAARSKLIDTFEAQPKVASKKCRNTEQRLRQSHFGAECVLKFPSSDTIPRIYIVANSQVTEEIFRDERRIVTASYKKAKITLMNCLIQFLNARVGLENIKIRPWNFTGLVQAIKGIRRKFGANKDD